jgi:hypothetical protein
MLHHVYNEISIAFGMWPFHADAFCEESQRFIMSRAFAANQQRGVLVARQWDVVRL